MPLPVVRKDLPWLRAFAGIAVLACECAWVYRTRLWTDVALGGGLETSASLTGLVRWFLPFLLFSACVLVPKWRSPRPATHETAGFRWKPVAMHFCGFAVFAAVTLQLLKTHSLTAGAAYLAAAWFLLGAVNLVTLGIAALPPDLLAVWDWQTLMAGWLIALASLVALPLFQSFWLHSSELSVNGVRWVLERLHFAVFMAGIRVGTDRFVVKISPVCSGYEGMGLFLAFSMAWLAWFRKEYRFPAALLLLPAGLAISWGLNILRIAGLILIGHYGHPDVALGGFHSQAGWLAFTLLAVGFCALSHEVPGIRADVRARRKEEASDDPAAVYLGPFIAIQAAALISTAASAGFEWLYWLRVVAPAAVFLWYRKEYARIVPGFGQWAYAAVVGVGVSVLWAAMAWRAAINPGPLAHLQQLGEPWRIAWWIFRFAGAVVVAPVAEELAFRGYLMRRLQSPDVEKVAPRRAGWLGLGISSLAFGLLHGPRWMEGTVAGLVYGHVYKRRGRLADAMLAHALTNMLLMTLVAWTGDWRFW